MNKHTATPWAVSWNGKSGCHLVEAETTKQIDSHISREDADFILCCVNSHEALVEALNDLISASATVFDHTQAHLKNSVKLDYLTYKAKAEQALKLAEEE